jgi:hypothetical protein
MLAPTLNKSPHLLRLGFEEIPYVDDCLPSRVLFTVGRGVPGRILSALLIAFLASLRFARPTSVSAVLELNFPTVEIIASFEWRSGNPLVNSERPNKSGCQCEGRISETE